MPLDDWYDFDAQSVRLLPPPVDVPGWAVLLGVADAFAPYVEKSGAMRYPPFIDFLTPIVQRLRWSSAGVYVPPGSDVELLPSTYHRLEGMMDQPVCRDPALGLWMYRCFVTAPFTVSPFDSLSFGLLGEIPVAHAREFANGKRPRPTPPTRDEVAELLSSPDDAVRAGAMLALAEMTSGTRVSGPEAGA